VLRQNRALPESRKRDSTNQKCGRESTVKEAITIKAGTYGARAAVSEAHNCL
jgi:hypothetical protein